MNKNLTEIVFVLDRSGSMQSLTSDTVDGFNSFVEKQKNEAGNAFLTTVLFDNNYEILHDRVNIQDIKRLDKEYYARGSTALLDAIGKTINNVGNKLSLLNEDDRPSNVIFFITTDGYENSSKEFDIKTIREMVKHQTEKYKWQFVFLGANMDAIDVAQSFNIQMAVTYTSSSIGTRSLYDTVSSVTSSFRDSGTIQKDWDKDIV